MPKRNKKNTSDRKLINITRAGANHELEAKTANQSNYQVQAILQKLADIYFRIDTQGIILEHQANKTFNFINQAKITPGKQLLECFPASVAIRFHQAINQVRQTQSVVSFAYSLYVGNNKAHCEAQLLPVESTEIIVLLRDITHIVQEAFLECGDHFRTIVENANNIISALTPDGLFSYVSPNWSENLGHEVSEVEGQPFAAFLHPKDLSACTDYFTKALITGEQQDAIEYRVKHKNGTWRWHSCYLSAIKDASGSIIYFLGICHDITVRKREEIRRQRIEKALRKSETKFRTKTQQLEEALRQLQQTQSQLIQSEKMSSLGQLVAGIAHEINNPVNFIYGNLKYANDYVQDLLHLIEIYQQQFSPRTPEAHQEIYAIDLDFIRHDLPKVLDSMNTGAERIRQIVLSLRNFSRVDEEGMKLVNIHEGIDNALLLLQNRLKSQPESTGIEVIKEYGDLPQVMCHPGQMNQVFMSLLTNAIDALEEIAIAHPQIQIRTQLQASDRIKISITDNGPGINAKIRDRIFDPFFTTKPVGKGTGMGLSISYQIIVKKHRGELHCVSTPGEGTEFVISIPIKVLEEA
ncbi:PAS domain S-box protein [Nostoc spongiaeforme FACHB-130]|uniref:histidine kinase n=1 Tax=Nostoc spongiaeforme FACHB-130 TaxID=1357510 RepID=A0ABR8FWQ0_9NOSO|nr:PAS domain S-box protein [Nostoc spongiaeforme FACHB-130]